jgi:cytochrome oxidase assembly protein ShyY1
MQGFRPARGLTIYTMVAVTAFFSLGIWQVRRHQWRTADLAAKSARSELAPIALSDAVRDVDASAFRKIELRGRFELADTILVGPVERGTQLGARIFTPLHLEGDSDDAPRVVVARGWVPQADTENFLPREAGTPGSVSDVVDVRGLALPLALRDATAGSRENRRTHFPHFNPDRPALVAKLNAQVPYAFVAVMLQSSESEAGGVPIAEDARPASPVDHRGYAITWFAVGALSLASWIEYGRRRARELSA